MTLNPLWKVYQKDLKLILKVTYRGSIWSLSPLYYIDGASSKLSLSANKREVFPFSNIFEKVLQSSKRLQVIELMETLIFRCRKKVIWILLKFHNDAGAYTQEKWREAEQILEYGSYIIMISNLLVYKGLRMSQIWHWWHLLRAFRNMSIWSSYGRVSLSYWAFCRPPVLDS